MSELQSRDKLELAFAKLTVWLLSNGITRRDFTLNNKDSQGRSAFYASLDKFTNVTYSTLNDIRISQVASSVIHRSAIPSATQEHKVAAQNLKAGADDRESDFNVNLTKLLFYIENTPDNPIPFSARKDFASILLNVTEIMADQGVVITDLERLRQLSNGKNGGRDIS